jgi:hypothetical protein
MEILFESNSETEEEFEFNGEIIVNKGTVQIVKFEELGTDEANSL